MHRLGGIDRTVRGSRRFIDAVPVLRSPLAFHEDRIMERLYITPNAELIRHAIGLDLEPRSAALRIYRAEEGQSGTTRWDPLIPGGAIARKSCA